MECNYIIRYSFKIESLLRHFCLLRAVSVFLYSFTLSWADIFYNEIVLAAHCSYICIRFVLSVPKGYLTKNFTWRLLGMATPVQISIEQMPLLEASFTASA